MLCLREAAKATQNQYLNLGITFANAYRLFSTQRSHSVHVGCQHEPMLALDILENRGPEGVRVSISWTAPGKSVALPGRSGEVAGGFGEVLDKF